MILDYLRQMRRRGGPGRDVGGLDREVYVALAYDFEFHQLWPLFGVVNDIGVAIPVGVART